MWPGRTGVGDWMSWAGRPLGTLEEVDLREDDLDEAEAGTSRILSLRLVVDSTVYSLEGSWETLYPSSM